MNIGNFDRDTSLFLSRGPRPRRLRLLIALDLFLFAATFLIFFGDPKPIARGFSPQANGIVFLAYFLFVFLLWASVKQALWNGHDWGRRASIFISLISLVPNVLSGGMAGPILNISSTALSVVWLFLLTRRETVAWCKGASL